MNNLLLLVDGSSLAYRSFYAFINNPLSTSRGEPTSAVFGYTRSIKKVLDELSPDYAAVSFDLEAPTFRKKEYEDYKAQRKKMPDELKEQIPHIVRVSEAAGLHVVSKEGYEADDVIATLVSMAEDRDMKVIIFTMDKDLMQLCNENVEVLNMRSSGEEFMDREKVEKKFGIPPEKIPDYLALKGDQSDNIPGIRGIGKKTAARLISDYGSMENIFSSIGGIKSKSIREKLEGKREEAFKWKRFIELRRDISLSRDIEDLKYTGIEKSELKEIFDELELYSLMEEWLDGNNDIDYKEVTIFKVKPDETYVIYPDSGKFGISDGDKLMEAGLEGTLKFLSEAKNNRLIVDDAKALAHLLGEFPEAEIFDLSIVHYLLNPNSRNHSPDRILLEKGFSGVDEKEKAVIIHKVAEKLEEDLKKENLMSVYREIEEPIIEILYSMENRGIMFDSELIKNLRSSIHKECEKIRKKIYNLAGEEFNLRSPKQMGEILFEKLGLPVVKRTKTGYSTDAEVLGKLLGEDPIIEEIMKYRELDKLFTSYIEPLIDSINSETGRIHASFQQTAAATGRITVTEPNLQTLPVRSDKGRRIRQSVIAPADFLILSCDYSQIELRILAHLSGDEMMLQSFEENEDIHTATAARIFGMDSSSVTNSERRKAKAVNFGIIYGISPYGLSSQLSISTEESSRIIDNYYSKHPGVEKWQKNIIEEAQEKGYVETICKRKRKVPELKNPGQSNYGKRIAMNTPIQGSAADIIKKAMIEIFRYTGDNPDVHMILQVHDELLFEVRESKKDKIIDKIIPLMEEVVELKVPLKVDYKFAENWEKAH